MTEVITQERCEERFDLYRNDFEGNLPWPVFETKKTFNFIGQFFYVPIKKGKKNTIKNATIIFSEYFDFTDDRVFDSTLVHEMIHYYMKMYNIKDNDDHGDKFLSYAKYFNEKYNLNVKPLSYVGKNGDIERAEGTSKLKWIWALAKSIF